MAKKFTRAEIRRIVGDACTDEIENELVALHLGVVDVLKEEIDNYKRDADNPSEVETLKQELEKQHKEFDDYKKSVENEKVLNEKKNAYRTIAKDAGLSEKGIEKALKYADWDKIELDSEGKIKDAKSHIKNIRDEWSEHIVTTATVGVNTANPVTTTNDKPVRTREEIMKIKDTTERQKAWADYITQKGN